MRDIASAAADALLDWTTADGFKAEVRDIMAQNFTQRTTAQRLGEIIANDDNFTESVDALVAAIKEARTSLLNICGADAPYNPDALHALSVLSNALKD